MGERAREFWQDYGPDIAKAAVGAAVVGVAIIAVSRFIRHKRQLSSEQIDQMQIAEEDAVLPIPESAKLLEGTGIMVDTAGQKNVVTDAHELAAEAPNPAVGEVVTVIANIAQNLGKKRKKI